MPPISEKIKNDFFSRALFSNGCWLWLGHTNSNGYGVLSTIGRKKILAHRLAYFIANNVDPADSLVCHHCDNRQCVRPDHLYLGDNAQNVRDMVARKRNHRWRGSRRGEANPFAKLTERAVRHIRASTEGNRPLARKLGVSPALIIAIRKGEAWSHVDA